MLKIVLGCLLCDSKMGMNRSLLKGLAIFEPNITDIDHLRYELKLFRNPYWDSYLAKCDQRRMMDLVREPLQE